MAEHSAITWTDATFNPWWGCFKISPGCKHCYADAFDHRLGGSHWGKDAPRRFFGDAHWNEPVKWNAKAAREGVRRRVFCSSMADVFEDRRDLDEHRDRLWKLIDATQNLDWLLLTKRPENFGMLPTAPVNVWRGVTVEDADHLWRVDHLRATGAAVRFISYEPALGPIASALNLDGIDWIVTGDESGQVRRPADVQWFADVRDKCAAAGVAFHFKQWAGAPDARIGGARVSGKIHLPILDGRVHAAFPDAPNA